MTGVKRTDDVLLAFRSLRARGVDARLCMVGDGPDREQVERRAHELGVMRETLFLGYQEDVAPYFAAFDAFVLPSANEGTPVTTIEALAAGLPVVATRVGGLPDVVDDGDDGFLVAPATSTRSRSGSSSSRATPSSASGWATPGASACSSATPSTVSSTMSTGSTVRCSRRASDPRAGGRDGRGRRARRRARVGRQGFPRHVGLADTAARAVRAAVGDGARAGAGDGAAVAGRRLRLLPLARTQGRALRDLVKPGSFEAGVDRPQAARLFARYYLLPATQVADVSRAQIVFTVGIDPRTLGVRLGKIDKFSGGAYYAAPVG